MDKPNQRQGLLESQPIKLASIKSAWESDHKGLAARQRILIAYAVAFCSLAALALYALFTANFIVSVMLVIALSILAWVFLQAKRNLKDFGNYE